MSQEIQGMTEEEIQALLKQISEIRHQINNPLMGILGHLELLLERPELPEDIKERGEKMLHESRKIKTLVEDLGQVVRSRRNY